MIKLVVVEDLDILREEIVEVLNRAEGLSVVADFARADTAIAYILSQPVDVVLMDIELESPKAGLLAAQTIRRQKPEIALLYLTAYETEDVILEAMAVGPADYVIKDCPDERLVQRVRAAYHDQVTLDSRVNKALMKEYSRLRYSERSLLFFIHNVGKLTPTEQELIGYILQDQTTREIAALRCVEPVTVKSQIHTLLGKFGCSRRKELADMIRTLNLEYLFEKPKL